MANSLDGVMSNALDGIKKMVDVDTVIGDPIVVNENVTLIPISKVSFGFAAGGSSFGKQPEKDNFGGGAGGGVKVTPVAFLVITGNDVKVISISENPDAIDKIASHLPEVFNQVTSLFSKDKKDNIEKTE
ncbi:MAG: GerW family sporulation protein [Clostridia bacterium]|nr:GerW family sporulation protein [Clostridia bacterium]